MLWVFIRNLKGVIPKVYMLWYISEYSWRYSGLQYTGKSKFHWKGGVAIHKFWDASWVEDEACTDTWKRRKSNLQNPILWWLLDVLVGSSWITWLCKCPIVLHPLFQGNGYWEFLLQEKGADVVAFDQNTVYPRDMRYIEIMVTCEGLRAD